MALAGVPARYNKIIYGIRQYAILAKKVKKIIQSSGAALATSVKCPISGRQNVGERNQALGGSPFLYLQEQESKRNE
ncbi:hypothetical protein DAPPUDRAFT_238869 [Daphnia pulex]|uniref:Uncharacterized protein n=1 Tax=Daphnia pulex TaxID=6669 RepID=E9G7N1_DAPPU|nr:hypothetical protein DAPPUDRAFT_238869 [Daphnia pulex]|eukprot:EFX84502.1 hypothetical protein DAPPUDRAFT_238869 [Daphnia pulex]